MGLNRVVMLAVLAGIAIAVIPEVLPTGPVAGIDAAKFLQSGSMWFAVGAIFLGGLLTSLTPCVYPLIPITVGVFGARQAESKGKAVLLTSAYVVGMGVVFSILGVAAAMSGKAFGSALGDARVVFGLAVFMLILASSMFGAFELALPTSLATRLNTVGGGGFVGALLMGSVSGFVAAPCTGPVLSGVLAWVASVQDPVIGGGLLFIYALGIGVPFFLIGVFAVRLPKGGVWMEWIKSVFGIALVALAVMYVRDASPAFREALEKLSGSLGKVIGLTVAVVGVVLGVGLGAIHRSFKEGAFNFALKGVGVLLVVTAFLVRMATQHVAPPVEAGGVDPLKWQLTFDASKVNSVTPFEDVLAKAKADCRPVMIDFFAERCAACKELDKLVYATPEVAQESARFVNIKIDGTEDHEVLTALMSRYGVQGLPTVAFIDAMGEPLESPKVAGFLPAEQFLGEMKKVQVATCSR